MSSICRQCSGSSQIPIPVDLETWTTHNYPPITNDCPGSTFQNNWQVAGNGESVIQIVNGQPGMFCTEESIFSELFQDFEDGITFTGQIRVEEPPGTEPRDDDYFGFAIGFNPGDEDPNGLISGLADFILVDWKREDQNVHQSCRNDECQRFFAYDNDAGFQCDSAVEACNRPVVADENGDNGCFPVTCQDVQNLPSTWNQGTRGISASQVLGLAHPDLFWSHFTCPAENSIDDSGRSNIIYYTNILYRYKNKIPHRTPPTCKPASAGKRSA